jgi:hypothetical protein
VDNDIFAFPDGIEVPPVTIVSGIASLLGLVVATRFHGRPTAVDYCRIRRARTAALGKRVLHFRSPLSVACAYTRSREVELHSTPAKARRQIYDNATGIARNLPQPGNAHHPKYSGHRRLSSLFLRLKL